MDTVLIDATIDKMEKMTFIHGRSGFPIVQLPKQMDLMVVVQGRGRYFWMGVQTFSRGPLAPRAPWSEGPYPIFYSAVFTDIGAFFKF